MSFAFQTEHMSLEDLKDFENELPQTPGEPVERLSHGTAELMAMMRGQGQGRPGG